LENLYSSSGSSSDDQDETVNENGIDDADPMANGLSSAPVVLSANSEPTNDGDGDNGNLTIDFGLVYYDLALVKSRSANQGYSINATTTPPSANFDIVIKNQTDVPVYNVNVIDYLPTGTSFNSLVSGAPRVTVVGVDGTSPHANNQLFQIDQLAGMETLTFTIMLDMNDLSQGAWKMTMV